jgi:deazaflavin-dependent oxidoreductase (nitroreductase family)
VIAPVIEVKVERTPGVKGALHVGQTRAGAAASAALVHPSRVVGAPRSVSGQSVIIAYFVDGPNLIAMAMNGWADGEPAWWLNLQAHPDASVDLVDGPRLVRARVAKGDERSRLWGRWREIDAKLDAYAALRSSETAVVILESRPEPGR